MCSQVNSSSFRPQCHTDCQNSIWIHIIVCFLSFATKHSKLTKQDACQALLMLPGGVCQSEAALQSNAAVYEELAEQQRRVTGGTARRVAGGHPGGSAGWNRRWLWFQLDGLWVAERHGSCLLRGTVLLLHCWTKVLSYADLLYISPLDR